MGSVPGLGRSPGQGNGYPFQYSCLENVMDREAWWATVHGVTKSRIWLSDWSYMVNSNFLILRVIMWLCKRFSLAFRKDILEYYDNRESCLKIVSLIYENCFIKSQYVCKWEGTERKNNVNVVNIPYCVGEWRISCYNWNYPVFNYLLNKVKFEKKLQTENQHGQLRSLPHFTLTPIVFLFWYQKR